MLLQTDRAEIFLNYLLSTREVGGGEHICVCRRFDGTRIELTETHKTQDLALQQGQRAAIIDSLHGSTTPQLLVVVSDEGERIVTSNGAADALFGGKVSGWPYSCAAGGGLYALIKAGQTFFSLHSAGSTVINQMLRIGQRTLLLVTINPA